MKDIPSHLWHPSYLRVGEKKTGGPNLRLLRLDPGKPSNTVTAFIFNKFVHPFEDRYITPREAARLQQFPDDHKFSGPITKIQLQIGNAVPVGLAEAVAQHVSKRFSETSAHEKPTAVGLFSGAGGMDLGFSKYFDIISSTEIDPVFCDTLRLNFPQARIIEDDIRNIGGEELAKTGAPDVIFGGPPCQPFSAAGKQRGLDDPRGTLASEYLRVVSEMKPRFFVLENVPGLVSNAKGGALQAILQGVQEIGYKAEWHILKAVNYGAPQNRRRLIVIGRRDSDEPEFGTPPPTHGPVSEGQLPVGLLPFATVRDAFNGLPPAQLRSARESFQP